MQKLTDKTNMAHINIKIPKELVAKARQAAYLVTGRTNLSEFIRSLIEAKHQELHPAPKHDELSPQEQSTPQQEVV